jgi:hypothetical protein
MLHLDDLAIEATKLVEKIARIDLLQVPLDRWRSGTEQ